MTRRRWIADTWDNTCDTAVLEGSQAAHLARVLRAQPGMQYDVVAGERVWRAEITEVSETAVSFRLLEELAAAVSLPITVLLSLYKFDRLEWAIEKLTELGVARLEPVISRRTEKHLALAAEKRAERWRKIAFEAAKQSRRTAVPVIADPRPLKEAILSVDQQAMRVLLAEQETEKNLIRYLQEQTSGDPQELVLAIGPEGGWTSEEQTLFAEQGWTSVTLGDTVLRAETAAIAAVAIAAACLQR